MRQLLTESLLLALVAAVLGFAVSRVAIEVTIYAVTSSMAPEIAENIRVAAPAADWRVAAFLVPGAIVSTVFFGLAPALQATRLELARTIRGDVTSDPRPSRARNVLIGVQVTASALLLICSAVFLRSALAASAVDPGIRTADTVIIDIVNEPLRDAMVKAVLRNRQSPQWRPRGRTFWAGRVPPSQGTAGKPADPPSPIGSCRPNTSACSASMCCAAAVSRRRTRREAAVVVVSECRRAAAVAERDAVGQVLHLEPDPNSETRRVDEPSLPARTFTVVGVVRDVPGFPDPGLSPGDGRLRADQFRDGQDISDRARQGRSGTGASCAASASDDDRSEHGSGHDDEDDGQDGDVSAADRLLAHAVLGGLALVLTLSGLFSVLSYLVEQRKKEIGVRMALGATTRTVARLVLSQSARPVGYRSDRGAGLAGRLAML